MTLEYSSVQNESEPTVRRRPWVEVTLMAGFIVSLLIGLTALAALFFVRQATAPDLADSPVAAFDPARITPELAVRHLMGDPAQALAYQALNAGELETAHASALFDTRAAGSERAGFWSALARAYQTAGRDEQRLQAYQVMASLAILDETIPPQERTQLLTQVAVGYLELGETTAARDALTQVKRMGEQLPNLLPAQRSPIFSTLLPVAEQLDDAALAAQLTELARNPFMTPSGVLLTPQLATRPAPLPLDQALNEALAARHDAARVLSDRITFTNGGDIEPERQALADALRREDQARNEYFQAALSGVLNNEQRLWLFSEQRTWQIIKERIALGAYGLSLVPEWEGNLEAIVNDVVAMTGQIDVVLTQMAGSPPTSVDDAMLAVEALNWLALQYELGFYPDAPAASIGERLRVAQETLASLGAPLALPVGYDAVATPPGFRLRQ